MAPRRGWNDDELLRDSGWALQSSSRLNSKAVRPASCPPLGESTEKCIAQQLAFRRQVTECPSFISRLQDELDSKPFCHYRSWLTVHSARLETATVQVGPRRPRSKSEETTRVPSKGEYSQIAPIVGCAPRGGAERGSQLAVDKCVVVSAESDERNGWMALCALCLVSSFNAFMCMNFSSCEQATVSALGISEADAAGLYSYYLVTCMLGMTPSMWLSDRHEVLSIQSGVWATIAAAWIRWWGLRSQSFGLCLLSQTLVGYGACPVSTLPGKISHQRFPPALRALTTSLMVQANYSGWLFGSSVPPMAVVEGSAESLTSFAFMQCVYSVFIGVVFFALYRPPPAAALAEDAASTSHVKGFAQILWAMCAKPQFSLQLVTHGLLGGIGFAVPSAIFFILNDLGCPRIVGPLANVAFIGTGVTAGVCFGYCCTDSKSYSRILKLCYVLCAAALMGCAAVVHFGLLHGTGLSVVLIALAAVAGFASLGFTGIAFEDLALFPDIPASYVIWIGYIFILGIAEPLNDFSSDAQGFQTLGYVALGTCIVFLIVYRQGGASTRPSFGLSDTLSDSSLSSDSFSEPLLNAQSIP